MASSSPLLPQIGDPALFDEPLNRCPLCGSGGVGPRYRITAYNPPFCVDRCQACGFLFMNPRFRKEVVEGFYKESYYRGNAEYSYFDEREAERYALYVWKKRLKVIRRYRAGGNFLDVGAAFGGFMKAASEYFTPYGIEVSVYSGAQAREIFGERLHVGTLADHPFSKDSFSVITMIEVLEHLPDPVSALRECHGLLGEGGLLVLQTANMEGLQARYWKERYAYFMPGHLSYFSLKNLAGLLERLGFRRVRVYRPVEFGLLPKLLKSRYTFRSPLDYRRWLRIALYHGMGLIHLGNFSLTSSMVVYAVK